jgi:hypothetical protein
MKGRPSQWRAILESQWKWNRGLALLGVLLGFSLPLLSLRMAAGSLMLTGFIATMAAWGVAYAIAAGALGLMAAVFAWSFDHRLRHVYALSLPIPRWRYVVYRYAAGMVTLALPVLAVFISAEIVAHSALVPKELHAYPIALTLRFMFAVLVAYSLFFAISAATPRTAGYILGSIVVIIAAQIMLSAASVHADILSRAMDLVFSAPGLLAVFGGRWTLIDV